MTSYHIARTVLEGRERLPHLYAGSPFSDPAMAILLALFLAEAQGQAMTITACQKAARIPFGSTQRFIGQLEHSGFVSRRPHPTDTRIKFLELTAAARAALGIWLYELGASLGSATDPSALSSTPSRGDEAGVSGWSGS